MTKEEATILATVAPRDKGMIRVLEGWLLSQTEEAPLGNDPYKEEGQALSISESDLPF